MKKQILSLLTIATLLTSVTSCGSKATTGEGASADTLTGEIQLSGAFALYPMAVKWAEEFQKIHPNVRIDVSGGGAGKGMTDVLAGVVDLGMVSREVKSEELAQGALPFAVVKDAVIPTINAKNPDLADILRIGLKKEVAAKLWNDELKTWGDVLGTASKTKVVVITRSDACGAAETWAAWFGKKQDNLKGVAVNADPGVSGEVQRNALAIGYNNISYAYDQNTKKPFEGLTIIPLDTNDNGVIDPEEAFYETSESLIAAINDGRYPSPPARDLYIVSKGKPTKPALVEFIKYVLTEGQKYAGETGYIGLSEEKLNAGLHSIMN